MSRVRRYMSTGSAVGGGPAVQNLEVDFLGGSAMFETERAAREGQTGPSLFGLLIAVPGGGALGNHVFFFRQVDQYGRTVGYDTSSLYPALASYTSHAVDMPAGVNDEAAVAAAFQAVAAGIYTSATRSGSTVTLSDPDILASSAFFPSTSPSPGQILGTQDVSSSSVFTQADSNVCTLLTPAFASTMYLRAIEFDVGAAYVDALRCGIYTGGAINAPAGTPLLWDSGLWPSGVATNGYVAIYPTSPVVIPASTRLHVLLKGATATTTEIGYQGGTGAGDWDVSPGGIWQVTGTSIGTNPAVALPSTFPAGGTNVSPSFTFNARLVLSPTPRADGALSTQYGVNVAASSLGFTTVFSANVLQGGNLPPQLEGMGLDYVAIAAEDDASFRLSAYQGGALEDPDGSALIYDLGRGPAGPGLPRDWYQLDVPAGVHAAVDRTQRIWTCARDNGVGTVAFSNVAGPGTAGPDTDPMQFPDNSAPGVQPEYESFSSNPAFSIDPADAFEANFSANTVTPPVDTLPGNVQGSRLGLRIRPVTLTAVSP